MPLARHLVIFTRLPRLGAGKRRLAAGIGPVQAWRFQRVMVSLTLRRLGYDRRWTTWIAATPDRSSPPGRPLWPSRFRILRQGQGDLGRRMARVAAILPPGPVVIIGGDIPGVTTAQVARAFRALGGHDAVFGPALDGGYWLAGLRRRPRFIDPFTSVRWSSEHALGDTVANLAGYDVALLDSMADVDDAASLASNPRWEMLHVFGHR